MNFNLTNKVDYTLQHSMTTELINLYGVAVKLLLVEKINIDDLVFGDYSHVKTDANTSFEIFGLPETSETWDNIGINFSEYGMLTLETVNLFFSRATIDTIFGDFDAGRGFEGILGNLIVLPNGRIVEITDIDFETPGISNLYTENDTKNVYKFTCKTYDNKLISETPATDITPVGSTEDYSTLDDYFNELSAEVVAVDTEAEVTEDEATGEPIVATDEDSVFGSF